MSGFGWDRFYRVRPALNMAVLDESPLNVGVLDESPLNAGVLDESPLNAGVLDESPINVDLVDESPLNVGVLDESPINVDLVDDSPINVGVLDESPLNVGTLDESPLNAGVLDESPLNVGILDESPLVLDPEVVDRRSAGFLAAGSVTQGAKESFKAATGSTDSKSKTPSTYSFFSESNYRQKYTLELYENEGSEPIASIELPYVNSLAMEQPLSVVRTWTLAGSPYEEHSGFQQRTFRISGRSGYSPMALTRFAKLRNFLEKYARLSAENMNAFVRSKDIKLVLNFLWEGESWWATVLNFRYQREVASTRVSYAYEITLVTNGVAATRWDSKNGINYITCSENKDDECHLSSLHYCHAAFEETFLRIPAKDLPVINTPSTAKIKKLTASAVRLSRGSTASAGIPSVYLTDWSYWYRLATLCNLSEAELMLSLRSLLEPQLSSVRGWVYVLMRYIVDLRMQCLMNLGSRFIRHGDRIDSPNSGNPHRPRPLPNRGLPVISIQVSQGQSTAMDIAAAYLGDRNLWTQITTLNGMIDARTKNDGSPVTPGDSLLVPSSTGLDNIDPDTFYGTNLRFRSGDLVSVGDRDIGLISGIDNFYQNFRHRMLTVRGENRTYPDFGLPKLIGSDDLSDVPGQVMSNVRRQTLSDHRVAEINEMTLTEESGSLDVSLTIVTALREKASTGFSYPT
jgi:hypothetical protein